MTTSGRAIWGAIAPAVRRVRLEGAVALALAVAALVPAGLVAAWLVGGWGPEGYGPLALWMVGLLGGLALLAALGHRWVRGVDERAVAAAAERARGLPEGSLRGILELGRDLPVGVSASLFRRSESELAQRVAGAGPRELAGELGWAARRRRARLLGGAAALWLVAVMVGFAAPERARASWAPLLHPVEHLRGAVLPALVVAPGDTVVDRGRALDVRVDAHLRTHVTLHWRSVGDVPRERRVAVEEGRAVGSVGPVESALSYWVRAPDGAVSDTFTARPRDPLMVTGLTLDVTYPAHVDRSADHYQGDPPLLQVPEGTRLRVAGRTSGPLTAARVDRAGGGERQAAVESATFRLDWTLAPADSGRWEWDLTGRAGERAVPPAPLEIRVVEDAPPQVRISFPGADTVLPASSRQPVLAEASDDYGLTSAALVFRVVDARGERSAPVSMPLPLAATVGRASLRGILDVSEQPLVPGDAVEYHVVVRDNAPDGQAGRSATYVLRLPSMAELRERARREAGEVVDETRRLAERASQLQSSTRDLSRRVGSRGQPGRGGGEPGGDQPPDRLGFEESSEARAVAGKQQEVLSQVEELRARMEELERAIAEAGLRDPELQRRMEELQELYERLAAPELREQLEALRDAVEALDPEAVRRALARLGEGQDELRRELARSLEMMRRAAAEQELNALAREAEEIAGRQEALAEAMRQEAAQEGSGEPSAEETPAEETSADAASAQEASARQDSAGEESSASPPPSATLPQARIEQQEELEERAEELNESLQSLQQQLLQMGEQQSSKQTGSAGEKGKASQESMAQATEEARNQRGQEAAAAGERAASQMSDAARSLDQARQQMAEAGQREASEAVQQATQDALSLAERQEALRRQMEESERQGGSRGESLQQMRSEQAALRQGLQQMGRNLSESGQRSALIEQQVRQALERARLNMDRTLEGLQEGGGRMPLGAAERSVESLNQLALSLLENDAGIQRSQAPGGVQKALRQLARAAQEQGSVNGRATALAPLQLAEQALTRQLHQVAEQQRGVARRIGDVSGMLGGRDDVLGRLDQLATDAAQIARELEGGRLDPEVMARQERLFHRLLDAGRSLEGEEQSDERTGRAAEGTRVRAPGSLDPGVLEAGVRYPAPTAEQLEQLPPAYRRLILEYFDRLNRGGGER